MITILWMILVAGGLIALPKVAALLVRKDSTDVWGKNFFIDFIRSMTIAVFSGSSETFYRMTRTSSPGPRIEQLWLGLNTLALGWLMISMFLAQAPFFMLQDGMILFHQSIDLENPPMWVFWLGSNSWVAILLGLALGALIRLAFRFTGLSLPLATGFLTTGMMSMPVAWGLFLGDFLTGACENYLRNRLPLFAYRLKIAMAFGLGGLLLAPLILGFSMEMVGGAYSAQLRWFQWFSLIVTLLFCETVASMLFFHFHWKKQGNTLK